MRGTGNIKKYGKVYNKKIPSMSLKD